MSRRMMLLLVLMALITPFSTLPAEAGGRWSVYLYSSTSNTVLRIFEDGQVEEMTLPVPEGEFIISQVAVGPAGRFAYCTSTVGGDAPPTYQFFLVDAGTIVFQVDVPTTQGCSVTSDSFSREGDYIVIGTTAGFEDEDQPAWRVLMIDTADGSIARELSSESPAMVGALENGLPGAVIPWPVLVNDEAVIFTLRPYFTDAPPIATSLVWDYQTDVVTTAAGWGRLNSDYLPATGELVWVDQDPDLPAGEPFGPLPANNIVRYQPSDAEAITIFHDPEKIAVDVGFIDNGLALAIQLLEPVRTDIQPVQLIDWVALDRDGNLTTVVDDFNGNVQVAAAPGGYLIFKQAYATAEGEIPAVSIEYHSFGQSRMLWETTSDESWQVIRATAGTIDPTNLEAFLPYMP